MPDPQPPRSRDQVAFQVSCAVHGVLFAGLVEVAKPVIVLAATALKFMFKGGFRQLQPSGAELVFMEAAETFLPEPEQHGPPFVFGAPFVGCRIADFTFAAGDHCWL